LSTAENAGREFSQHDDLRQEDVFWVERAVTGSRNRFMPFPLAHIAGALQPGTTQRGAAATKLARRPKTWCLPPLIRRLCAARLRNICCNSTPGKNLSPQAH